MAVPWGLVVFLVGIAFGYFAHGRQDKSELFKKGILIGLAVSILVAIAGWVFGVNALGLTDNGILANIIATIVLAVIFVIGVWLGDLIEGRTGHSPRTGSPRV